MRPSVWRIVALIAVIVGVAGFLWVKSKHKDQGVSALSFDAVERRTLVVTIEATGTVEPIDLVEVKSKASGQIVRMPVDVGSHVKVGDLLVQIDPTDVKNAYQQAQAALSAARVQVEVAGAQRKRADELFKAEILTAPEHEAALLADANAQSSLVSAQTNLENARLRLQDATVRAPSAGTVLDKPVGVGQVISSATSSVSGGTTLLQMADLRRIRVRALVPESDIGGVKEGMEAAISVDAYPNQTFEGRVEKVEPQAVVQQSVTMFPVLLSIANEEGLLLPGMNGDVVITTARAEDVLSVPVDALRSVRELSMVATAVGVPVDSLRASLRASRAAMGGGSGAGFGGSGGGAGRDSTRGAWRRGGKRGAAGGAAGDSTRWGARRGRSGGGRWGGGAGGAAGAPTNGGASMPGAMAGGAMGSSGNRNAQFAVVKTAQGYSARFVRLGLSNFDYAQVLFGLAEGDSVALLGAAEMQAERAQSIDRIRQRVGGGLPGTAGGARGGGGQGSRGGSRGGG